jgi:nucleoside-diphosphate-sugar epimerase
MSETVLVTGGSGFVGGWCVVELLKRGYAVRTTVRSLSKAPAVYAMVAKAVDPADRLEFFAADLTQDEGWDEAVAGCDYVLHVASPLVGNDPRDPDSFIIPARDGTLRVLRAATRAGVKRVVMTSSTAASCPPVDSGDSFDNDESLWTDPSHPSINPYRQSKTLAERAAWDFMDEALSSTTLTTILPSAIFGPVLTTENLGSVQVISRLLSGRLAGTPRLGFSIVDVRDLAQLHIRAMTTPEAAGHRFIAAGDYLWMADIARILRSQLGDRASKVPTRGLPDFVLRIASLFDPPLRFLTPSLGRKHTFTSAKAQRMLGWKPRPVTATLIDCAESLLADADGVAKRPARPRAAPALAEPRVHSGGAKPFE